MTREEIITELQSMLRQSEDAIKASKAGTEAHRPEYEALCNNPNVVNHERLAELYSYIVHWPQEAHRQQREANTFRAAIEMLTHEGGQKL